MITPGSDLLHFSMVTAVMGSSLLHHSHDEGRDGHEPLKIFSHGREGEERDPQRWSWAAVTGVTTLGAPITPGVTGVIS